MDEWTPDHHEVVEGRDIFMWTIPAQIAGLWRVKAPGHRDFVMRIWQTLNDVRATAITLDEHSIPAMNVNVQGSHFRYTLNTAEGPLNFEGTVQGARMKGTGTAGEWTAERM